MYLLCRSLSAAVSKGAAVFFALSHRILNFDTGNEATVLHLRAKPGNCGYFSNEVAAFICTTTTMIIVFG